MARLNVKLLVEHGTAVADHVVFVCTDPATVKAAAEAGADIAQAARSSHALIREALSAWERSSRH